MVLGEPSGGSEQVWCAAELQKLAGEDDYRMVVPAGYGYCGDIRRLQASAAEVPMLLEARGGLRSYGPTSAKFAEEVQQGPRRRGLLRSTRAGRWCQEELLGGSGGMATAQNVGQVSAGAGHRRRRKSSRRSSKYDIKR